jgi:serine O-acetyltransferase
MNTLFIGGNTIGERLMLWHAFSTIINAESIGKDCTIFQQVTIGKGKDDKVPTIGNNVVIFAGAIIIGGISIGDNVKIGAGAVVTKNIPENCTVVGCSAYIVKRNGIKVKEEL